MSMLGVDQILTVRDQAGAAGTWTGSRWSRG